MSTGKINPSSRGISVFRAVRYDDHKHHQAHKLRWKPSRHAMQFSVTSVPNGQIGDCMTHYALQAPTTTVQCELPQRHFAKPSHVVGDRDWSFGQIARTLEQRQRGCNIRQDVCVDRCKQINSSHMYMTVSRMKTKLIQFVKRNLNI
jgi:hypothetical protein